MWTIPNALTLVRILLIGPVIMLLEQGRFLTALGFAIVLFVTDFLDGQIARRFHQTSYVGAILDPVADKLVVLSLFGYLLFRGQAPAWYFALIATRDVAQLLSIPVLLWAMRIEFQVRPSLIAKWGTALNFILLGVLFVRFFVMQGAAPLAGTLQVAWFDWLIWPLLAVSSLAEVYILVTYVPRFFQIALGTHDTFE